LIVTEKPETKTPWAYEEDEQAIVFRTERLRLVIQKRTGSIAYLDRHGHVLVKEPARGGRSLVPHTVKEYVYDEAAGAKAAASVDGVRAEAAAAKEVRERTAYHGKLMLEWAKDEALFGLGSHEEGFLNLRGTSQYLYQHNLKAVVPV